MEVKTMARYTLNTGEICEQLTGLRFNDLSGLPFDRIDDIANAAIPKIFSDRYDLLDNGDDRKDLLRMVLEHYWEYEVCCYTPADFVLRINRKLNEIAPLYNQRYQSTKLEYPIFDDIKYNENGTDAHEDHGTTSNEGNTKHSDQDVFTSAHTGTVANRMDEDGKTTVTDNDKNVQKHTGTIGVKDQESGTTKVITDDLNQDLGHTTTTAGAHLNQELKETADHKSTDWNYNNDTPQNSISGIRDSDYLTGYSKSTHEKDQTPFNASGKVSGTYFDGHTYDYSITDKIDGQPTSADHMERDMDTGITDQRVTSSGDTKDHNEATTTHGRGNEQTTTFNDTIETKTDNEQTTKFGKGQLDTTTYGDTTTNTTQYGHNIATKDSGTNDNSHSGEYQKNVEGKANSSKSYMQMLQEYRDVMINIYTEIIEELHELFFIIY